MYQPQDFPVYLIVMVDVSGAIPAAAEGVYGRGHPADHPAHYQEVSQLGFIIHSQFISIVST